MVKKIDNEEKVLLESYEEGAWQSVADREERINDFQEIAAHSLKKDKRINIRINSNDLLELKRKAMHEGIPYQTLISSILHKYAKGRFVEGS